MRIRAGYNLTYECPQPTPMLLVLEIHPSRRGDLLTEQIVNFDPPIESRAYIDGFGNACTRIEAPAGLMTISTDFQIYDSGKPDIVALDAVQHDIKDLPDDVLVFLLGSRYATLIGSAISHGRLLAARNRVGRGFRRSATSSTITSPSTIKMRMLSGRRMADTPTRRAYAVISPTSRSRFAAA
jgi:hypothetical protein